MMASAAAVGSNPENASKFLEVLQSDLKVLASETKKKYPQIKEVCNRETICYILGYVQKYHLTASLIPMYHFIPIH